VILGGAFKEQGRQGYAFAVSEGFRGFGPAVYAELMSWGKNPWLFQSSMAKRLGCSVRTVQRWLARYRDAGLLQCFRSKKNETPPGAKGPVSCGFSNRVLTAWRAAGARFDELVSELRERRARRKALKARGQSMTAEQIDRELVRRYGPDP
jgi:hypothetical protein